MDAGLVALAAEVLTCPGMCVATRVRSLLTLRNVVWCASGRRTAGRNKVLVAKLVAIMKDTDDAVNDAIDSDAEDAQSPLDSGALYSGRDYTYRGVLQLFCA